MSCTCTERQLLAQHPHARAHLWLERPRVFQAHRLGPREGLAFGCVSCLILPSLPSINLETLTRSPRRIRPHSPRTHDRPHLLDVAPRRLRGEYPRTRRGRHGAGRGDGGAVRPLFLVICLAFAFFLAVAICIFLHIPRARCRFGGGPVWGRVFSWSL
jgi:hypothetical protein